MERRAIQFQGFNILVENPAGWVRSGKDKDGHAWTTRMVYDYGYIYGVAGQDGDGLDCYVGLNENVPNVFIVHQLKKGTGKYDEDKVMLGFPSLNDAKAAFLMHYDSDEFLGPITVLPVEMFRKHVAKMLVKKPKYKRKNPVIGVNFSTSIEKLFCDLDEDAERYGTKTKSKKQVGYLLSDGSPLTKTQRDKLKRELHQGEVKVQK